MLSSRIEMSTLAELAAQNACRSMRVDPLDLPRLAQLVVDSRDDVSDGPPLTADIRFDEGPERLPRVQLTIAGRMKLECQRCLQPFEYPVEIDTVLTMLMDEDQGNQIEDPFDSILVSHDGLNIEAAIEDEILAALPIAPVHGPESDCGGSGKADVETQTDAVQMNRPFAGLASLIGRTGNDRNG
jgi:uncharacterized protein